MTQAHRSRFRCVASSAGVGDHDTGDLRSLLTRSRRTAKSTRSYERNVAEPTRYQGLSFHWAASALVAGGWIWIRTSGGL
ncbi:hypothetical protein E0500_000800 [Streptomyces sp. KM273126]|nr:hypothetical protein [Streptomyces sp. KM273126]MBA2806040.1 hypothetical protein [Streptomyces sp. KM273126]